jgi:hypothetical protein
MDLNRFPIPLMPVILQVWFVYKSKIELRNIIVRDRGERVYQVFLRSSRILINPKIFNGNLWFYNYI